MPIDVRKLIFSKSELREAFQDYCHENRMVNVQSPLENFEISDGAQDTLMTTVNFSSNDPKKPITIKLDENKIFEVLVGTCKKLSIPLPRKGHKYLQRNKEGLAITIGLNEAELRKS